MLSEPDVWPNASQDEEPTNQRSKLSRISDCASMLFVSERHCNRYESLP
jgi:hypothetical protein